MPNEIALKDNEDWVHKLFYWTYPEGSVLSKTKLVSIAVFIFFFVFWTSIFAPWTYIPLSILFAGLTFLLGFGIHRIISKPSVDKIRNNDYGLLEDIKHLLFFWQDNSGNFTISKTKIISFFIFVVMFIARFMLIKDFAFFVAFIFAIVLEIPVFVIGSLIHKLTFKDSPKKEIPSKQVKPKEVRKVEEIPQKTAVIPEYLDYQIQLDSLNSKFIKKEKSTRRIIEKRFEPPQITYNRFIGGVDKSAELFKKHMDSAYTMINLADEYSPRIAKEVESKIALLKAIIGKMDDLSNELVLNDDLSKEGEVDNLIGEMDNLIQSVKKYDS